MENSVEAFAHFLQSVMPRLRGGQPAAVLAIASDRNGDFGKGVSHLDGSWVLGVFVRRYISKVVK